MRRVRPSPAREDYLQAILQCEEEGAAVIQARLAEQLGVTPPSVSEAVHGLVSDGLAVQGGDRRISLTDRGRQLAEATMRRHRLAERLLSDLLGVPWHEVHEEAHKLEHGLSDRVVEAATHALGNPQTCPHGIPIPGSGHVAPPDTMQLSEAREGETVVLERLTEDLEYDPDTLRYLGEHGFIPGRRATVCAVAPDGTLTIEVEGRTVAIGTVLAANLFVSRP